MGNKTSKDKLDNYQSSAQRQPLPAVPSENSHEKDNGNKQTNYEFRPGAKVFIVLHDFEAIGHNTISVYKNEKVELRNKTEVWSDVFVPRINSSGWIPSNFLAPLNSLSRYPWYHKHTTRSKAEWLLRNGINGSFLVRESESNPGQYSLSVRHDGKKYHYRIQSLQGRFWINEETKFKDLAELVHYHSLTPGGLITTLTHPIPNDTKPALTALADEWEIDRESIILDEKLGSGQYGEVYKGIWYREKNLGIPIAVKTLKADSASQDEFMKEASLMKRLKHENLLHLLGVCTTQKPFFIITEYMPLGNLLEYIRTSKDMISSESLLHIAVQIASGMKFLEKVNLVHRDLACRNCLVGEGLTIRICDFGLSRLLDEDAYTAREGTKFPIKWTAPESLNYNIFTMKSDVWSFGVVLWELATQGETPYPSIDLQDVLGLLETGYRMKRPEGCPEQVYKLMKTCWEWEPDDRPTFAEIVTKLDNMFASTSVEQEVEKTLRQDYPTPKKPETPRLGARGSTERKTSSHLRSTPDQYPQLMSITSRQGGAGPSPVRAGHYPVVAHRPKTPGSFSSPWRGDLGMAQRPIDFPHRPVDVAPRPHDLTQSTRRSDAAPRRSDVAPPRRVDSMGNIAFKRFTDSPSRQSQPTFSGTKNRSNSDCSSTSSSSRQEHRPSGGSPGELFSELKLRQSRRGQNPNNGSDHGEAPSPANLPAKPKLLPNEFNSRSRSESPEDFSFKAVLNRAKIQEAENARIKKIKPVPPPKPKINLT